jgi:hypothetical protein
VAAGRLRVNREDLELLFESRYPYVGLLSRVEPKSRRNPHFGRKRKK